MSTNRSEHDRQSGQWWLSGCDPQWSPDGPDTDEAYAREDRAYRRRRAMIEAIDRAKDGER